MQPRPPAIHPNWLKHFTCPITQEFFCQPVITLCGHAFEKSALQNYFAVNRSNNCPNCRKPTQYSDVVSALKEMVIECINEHKDLASDYYLNEIILKQMIADDVTPPFINDSIKSHQLTAIAVNAYLKRMQTRLDNQEYEKVIRDAALVTTLQPTAQAYYLCALAYLKKNAPKLAQENFAEALRLNPEQVDCLLAVAKYQLKMGETEAPETLQRLVRLAPNRADVRYLVSRQKYKTGLIEEAIQECKEATRLDPKHFRARFLLARLLYKNNQVVAALQHFELLLNESKQRNSTEINLSKLNYYLGKAHEQQGQRKHAILHLERALTLNPHAALKYKLHKHLGILYYHEKQFSNAFSQFKQAVTIKPSRLCYLFLGLCAHELHDHANALDALQKAICLEGNLTPERINHARLTIATIYQKMREWEKAELAATDLLAHCPDFANAYALRCIARMALHNYSKAKEDSIKAGNLVHFATKGAIELALEKPTTAIEYFSKAIASDPNNGKYYFLRAKAQLKLDPETSLSDFCKATTLIPRHEIKAELYIYRAKALIKTGTPIWAATDCTSALQLAKQEKSVPHQIKAIKLRQKANIQAYRIEEAKQDCDLLIETDPNNPRHYVRRALTHVRMGNHQKARQDLKTAAKKPGKDNRSFLFLAIIHYLNKNYQEALPALDQCPIQDDHTQLLRIKTLIALSRFDEAMGQLAKTPSSSTIDSELLRLQIYTLQHNHELEVVRILNANEKNSTRRLFLIAMRYVFLNDFCKAHSIFNQGIGQDNKSASYQLAIATNALAIDNFVEAENRLCQVAKCESLLGSESFELQWLFRKLEEAKKLQVKLSADSLLASKALKMGTECLERSMLLSSQNEVEHELACAISHFSNALNLPSHAAYFFRGLAYREVGHFSAALADFKKSVDSPSPIATHQLELALTYACIANYEAAWKVLAEIKDSSLDTIHLYRARIYYIEGKLGEALHCIDLFRPDISPQFVHLAHLTRTAIYIKQKNEAMAVAEFKKIDLSIIPVTATRLKFHAIKYYKKIQHAETLYQEACKLSASEAFKKLDQVMQFNPQHRGALLLKCKLFYAQLNREALAKTIIELKALPLQEKELAELDEYEKNLKRSASNSSIFRADGVSVKPIDPPPKPPTL